MPTLTLIAAALAVTAAALLAGLVLSVVQLRRTRTALAAAQVARASAVDAQHRTAELAVAAERIRIVREMHDVLAHSLAIMIAQADGGSYVVADQARARRAFLTIAETGRAALNDTRRVLGCCGTGPRRRRRSRPPPTTPPSTPSWPGPRTPGCGSR